MHTVWIISVRIKEERISERRNVKLFIAQHLAHGELSINTAPAVSSHWPSFWPSFLLLMEWKEKEFILKKCSRDHFLSPSFRFQIGRLLLLFQRFTLLSYFSKIFCTARFSSMMVRNVVKNCISELKIYEVLASFFCIRNKPRMIVTSSVIEGKERNARPRDFGCFSPAMQRSHFT